MNIIHETYNTMKQIKRQERNKKTAIRRAMHKFQLNWYNKNIKYKDRNLA